MTETAIVERPAKTFDGIGITTQFTAPPFLGVIVADTLIEGKYGKQWFYAVRPVRFALGGIAFKDWVNPSSQPGQKLDIIVRSFAQNLPKEAIDAGAGAQLGDGSLIGSVAYFGREYHPLFDGKTRTVMQKQVLVALASATDEEIAEASALEPVAQSAIVGNTVASTSAPVDNEPATPFEMTDARREALTTILAETDSIARLKLASSLLKNTDPELLQRVVSGEGETLLGS